MWWPQGILVQNNVYSSTQQNFIAGLYLWDAVAVKEQAINHTKIIILTG